MHPLTAVKGLELRQDAHAIRTAPAQAAAAAAGENPMNKLKQVPCMGARSGSVQATLLLVGVFN